MTDRLTDDQECKIAEAIRVYGGESTRTPIGALATCMNTIKVVLAQAQPQPVDGALVDAMLDVYKKLWQIDDKERMAAALRVAADRMLAKVSDVEWGKNAAAERNFCNSILANRRARLTAKKTPEEQVTMRKGFYESKDRYWIYADDRQQIGFDSQHDAEIYRLGLIAKLRESEGHDGKS